MNTYNSPQKLLFLVNVDWFFISHRLELAIKAKKMGFDVIVACKDTGVKNVITDNGLIFIDLPFSRSGLNVIKEFNLLFRLYKIYLMVKPNIVHHVSLKAVIYGSIISSISKIPNRTINVITGLGYVFSNISLINNFLRRLFLFLFKFLSDRSYITIFQNHNDLNVFTDNNIINNSKAVLIRGSGVDLNHFKYSEELMGEQTIFMLHARLLYDKGVEEFVKASEFLVNKYGKHVKCVLAGPLDSENKSRISQKVVEKWVYNGGVEWLGEITYEQIPNLLREANVIVLPSYHEGLPKSLIEAGAIGRAVITTDVPGCNEIIKDGKNGLLVPPKEITELINKMEYLINNPQKRSNMGVEARKIVEEQYGLELVVNETIRLYM